MFSKAGIFTVFLCVVLLAAACQGHAPSCWDTRQDLIDRREILREGQCMKPRNTAVQIKVPEGYDYVYPSAVVVPQCTGHICKMPDEECVAIETKIKRVKIEAFTLNGVRERSCQYENIVEHLSCGCRCDESEKQCSVNEVFVRKMCRCECQPKLKEACEERMEARPGMYMWDPRTCTCPCNNLRQMCGDGEIWAEEYCRCLQIMSNEIIN